MAAKIGVLEPRQSPSDRPTLHVKRSVAEDLVSRGLAVWVQTAVIQRVDPKPRNPKKPLS